MIWNLADRAKCTYVGLPWVTFLGVLVPLLPAFADVLELG